LPYQFTLAFTFFASQTLIFNLVEKLLDVAVTLPSGEIHGQGDNVRK
jgi:hypothetical protein